MPLNRLSADQRDRYSEPSTAKKASSVEAKIEPTLAAQPKKKRADRRSDAMRRLRRRQRLSPITRKILLVNLLALLIPIVGMLYLGPYRDSLIQQELEALKEQGEIFSGALGEGAIGLLENGQEVLNIVPARDLVRRLSAASEVRARFFLADGSLAVDSRLLGDGSADILVEELEAPVLEEPTVPVKPVLNWIDRLSHWVDSHEYPIYSDHLNPTVSDYSETVTALSGEYATAVRRDDENNLILSVALPVQRFVHVFGALMLSRDGARIEQAMADVRLTILIVFAGALVITVLVSLYFAGTIARPLHRLADAAEKVRHSVGREPDTIPDLSYRSDEIGDLSGVLREMTGALTSRITAIERFAADVSHEIKNPLTSLKSAIETIQRIENADHQRELLRIVKDDVERLDRLITDISDASRLDAELGRTEANDIDLARMIETLVSMRRTVRGEGDAEGGVSVRHEVAGDGPFVVKGMESRLVQVLQNLIDNAVSFSPPDGTITLSLGRDDGWVVVRCEDEGPGLPEGKLEAIFDRFYSERPQHEKFGAHSGLGLSICKQIIEAHDGAIHAENRRPQNGRPGGARFVIRLPAAV